MFRLRSPSRRLLAVVTITLALLLAAETVALAATLTKNGGPVTAVRTVSTADDAGTILETWSAVPGMSVTVNVPEGEKALLIITFSATSSCYDGDGNSTYCYVRIRIDGTAEPPPGAVVFDTAMVGLGREASSMQWVAGPVSAGSHTVRVDYKVDEPSSAFQLGDRTLTVLRAKA